MFLQEGLNLINWFIKSGVSYLIAHQHVHSRPCVKIIVSSNGMTKKNYHGVYRSESKENPIVVLTLDLSASEFECLYVQFLFCYNRMV